MSLKLADFGSCRSIHSKQPYTEYISTRWYRAPECLLTDGYYSHKMDMWSVGCVFFEVMSLHPLFPGSNEVDQIAKIHDIIGTPEPDVLEKLRNKTRGVNFNFPSKRGSGIEPLLPHASVGCVAVIKELCLYDPDKRMSAQQAVRHVYFKDLRDHEKRVSIEAKRVNHASATENVHTEKDGATKDSSNNNVLEHKGGKREKGQVSHGRTLVPKLQDMEIVNGVKSVPVSLSYYTADYKHADGKDVAHKITRRHIKNPDSFSHWNHHLGDHASDCEPTPSEASGFSKVTIQSISKGPAYYHAPRRRKPKRTASVVNSLAESVITGPKSHIHQSHQPTSMEHSVFSSVLNGDNFPKISSSALQLPALSPTLAAHKSKLSHGRSRFDPLSQNQAIRLALSKNPLHW